MGTQSLVAFDVDHIKQYVFATDKLKEIRGASSLLDRFNRDEMAALEQSPDIDACPIYANGGSGLFLIDEAKANIFVENIQQLCKTMTGGAASVTCVVQPLPPGAPEIREDILNMPLHNTLKLLRSRLRMAKGYTPEILTLTSHPFLCPCHACGVFYAEQMDHTGAQDRDEEDALYCASCLLKRKEDMEIKKYITWKLSPDSVQAAESLPVVSSLWCELLDNLSHLNYRFPPGVGRPHDFNVFQGTEKNYIGIIYADANGMGKKMENLSTLGETSTFAKKIDDAIYWAVSEAIAQYLPVDQFNLRNPEGEQAFPFDILLLGGDDVVIVTPASAALQVAQAIATSFYTQTNGKPSELQQQSIGRGNTDEQHSLSVGVVLAPVKYPFKLLQDLANDTLKFAKRAGSSINRTRSAYGKTRINFMVVTGSLSHDFTRVHAFLTEKDEEFQREPTFYATLRPYTVEQLDKLLAFIRAGHDLGLGRTKLHQLREAVLRKNLTTSLSESRAILVNWREKQRDFVLQRTYALANDYQQHRRDENNPASLFPRVIFPWFLDGMEDKRPRYRSAMLDFVELFDFVTAEEGKQHGAE